MQNFVRSYLEGLLKLIHFYGQVVGCKLVSTEITDMCCCKSNSGRIWVKLICRLRCAIKLLKYYIVTDLLKVLLGNRWVNTYHSNESRIIGCPMLGNAWVNMPDNNTWCLLLSSWCVFHVWLVWKLYNDSYRYNSFQF
jgi:hypothetical protein